MKRARTAPLWGALLISVLAHAITLSGRWIALPQTQADPPPLLVRLAPVPPPASTVKPVTKPRATPARVAAAPAIIRSDAPAPWAPPAAEPVAEIPTPEVIAQPEPPAPPTEPVVVATAAPTTLAAAEPALIKTLPRRGRISYTLSLYLSGMSTEVGRTVLSWEANDNTYTLNSRSDTTGLARLTRFGPRIYQSSGLITERGLQPQSFTSKVVISGKSDDTAAVFDWSKNSLAFGSAADPKTAELPAGSQDLLSFMYHFSLAPPPRGRLQLPLTNGGRFERYDIDVLDEETIETPLGNLRALPIKQIARAGRETIEVWLAAEYRYLPVRIRVTNRDGTPGGEQIATEISIGEK